MRVETLELLRCPAAHEPSSLITVAYERRGDRIVDGALGCAVCGAEYAIRAGVAVLHNNISDQSAVEDASSVEAKVDVDATRLAALLSLSEPGMRVALCGPYARAANQLEALVDARCISINDADRAASVAQADRMEIDCELSQLPFASASLHGLAVDHAHRALLHDAARVVRAGGRVIAPVTTDVPQGCRELARDAFEWVAQVEENVSARTTKPVALTRA